MSFLDKLVGKNEDSNTKTTGMTRDVSEDVSELKGERTSKNDNQTISYQDAIANGKSMGQLLDEANAMLETPDYAEGVKMITQMAEGGLCRCTV